MQSLESDDYLRPLTGSPKRKKFLVCDIESKDGPTQKPGFTRPFMVGVYDGENFNSFFQGNSSLHYSTNNWDESYWKTNGCVDRALRSILLPKFINHHIYAHNAGRFDYLFFLPWLMNVGREIGFEFEIVPSQSSIQVLDVFRKNARKKGRWRFLDSYRLIPTSLDKMAKSFGFGGKLEFDLETPEWDRIKWTEYNKVDCVKLYQVIEKFHDLVEQRINGEVGITAPATAMKVFRRNYLKGPIPRNQESHAFIVKSYFGGRVEVIKEEGVNLKYYDFNSSYAASMLEPMPAGDMTEWEGIPPPKILENQIGFVEADVYIPEDCHIPPLPITYNEKLTFPVGNLRGVWDWHELQLIYDVGGHIERWGKSFWFQPVILFRDMVLELYQYRNKESSYYDESLSEVAKLMLNSLYGKFGMNTNRKRIIILGSEEPIPIGAKPASGDPDCLVYYAEEEIDAPYIIPQIAAHITSLGRIRLWRVLHDIESRRSGRVYYCDTDSVITDIEIMSGTQLGALKNEYPGIELSGRFVAPKVYYLKSGGGTKFRIEKRKCKNLSSSCSTCFGAGEYEVEVTSQVKAKGIPRDNRDLETLLMLMAGGELKFHRLEKLGTLARDNFSRGPAMVPVKKSFRGGSTKRIHLGDGTTRPITVKMW